MSLLLLCACWGKSSIDVITPWTPPADPVPETPQVCVLPAAKPIASLLRVSNFEYQQLATDLLKTPVGNAAFTRWVPVPAVFGFDTMSEARIDAQSLNEQLKTAELLTAQLLASPEIIGRCPAPTARPPAVCTEKATYDATGDFSGAQNQACWSYLDSRGPMTFSAANGRWESAEPGTFVWNTGLHPGVAADAIRRWTSPHDGAVTFSGEFRDADPGGGNGITAVIRKNGAELWRSVIANASGDTFDLRLTLKRGDTVDFVVNATAADPAYDSTALSVSIGFTAALNTAGWTWDSCAKPIVEHVASRMLRRPLRAEELADYASMFTAVSAEGVIAEDPNVFWTALQTVTQAALIPPSVLYKSEAVGALPADQRSYEVASRLSLFFCSSFPDEQLWALAANGMLNDPKVVEAEATRLLDKCLHRFADNFAGQWLAYRARLDAPDMEPLTPSMRRESAEVFAALVASNAKATDLLAPGFTLVDQPLATHYGLDFGPADGQPLHRITTSKRGGLFTHAHFLTSTAKGSDFKRVIDRGIWTLNRVLCRQLPPLNAATREEIASSMMSLDPNLSLAERMKEHRNKATACYTCHSQMDPIGLSLEKYDGQGLWRDTYADGKPITNDFKLDGVDVRDPNELSAVVAKSPDFGKCVVTQLLTYGLNRPMTDGEKECTAQQMAFPLDRSQPSLKSLIVSSFITSLRLTGGLK